MKKPTKTQRAAMREFTPGPWVAIGKAVYTSSDSPSREILWGGHNTRSASDEEKKANARLIAAAPDMYKLLEKVREGNAYDVVSLAIEAGDVLAKINNEKLPVYDSVDAYAAHLFGRGEA